MTIVAYSAIQVEMWLITACGLLLSASSVYSTSTITVAPSSTVYVMSTATTSVTPEPCSNSDILSGVAVGAFLLGLIVGALGVCLGLLAIKRPCSVDSHMSSSEKTQRFTRSETITKQQSLDAGPDPTPSSPLYHTKQETAATDNGEDSRDEEEETEKSSKGPLPPVPPPPAPAPLPPAAATASHTPPAKPTTTTTFTEEYDIPYVRSATKPSETPLEEYDIPDISTPLGLTVKPLSKSQTNIAKDLPSNEKQIKVQKKPLVPSKSLGNIPGANHDEMPSEHYYVMDMNADSTIATMPR